MWYYAYVIIDLYDRSVINWAFTRMKVMSIQSSYSRPRVSDDNPFIESLAFWNAIYYTYAKRKGLHCQIFASRNEILSNTKEKFPNRWGKRNTKKFIVKEHEILNPKAKKLV